jgi:hypothetical protein
MGYGGYKMDGLKKYFLILFLPIFTFLVPNSVLYSMGDRPDVVMADNIQTPKEASKEHRGLKRERSEDEVSSTNSNSNDLEKPVSKCAKKEVLSSSNEATPPLSTSINFLKQKDTNQLPNLDSNPIKLSDLIVFIDNDDELDNVGALSIALKVAIQEESAPCLIFGKHLLVNALAWKWEGIALKCMQIIEEGVKSSDFRPFLSNWIVLAFSYNNREGFFNNLEGFLLIPKAYVQNWFKVQDISKLNLSQILVGLGFLLDDTDLIPRDNSFFLSKDKNVIKINRIKEKAEIRKERACLAFKEFSALVPEVCKKLLSDMYPKVIYVAGHGSSIGCYDCPGGVIASLFTSDALKLFSILDDKKTLLAYVCACFLGGENLIAVENMLNAKESSNMIFISGATSQIATGQMPHSFKKFFDAAQIYLNKEPNLSEKEKYSYIAHHVAPWILENPTHEWFYQLGLTAKPQARLSGKNSKFHSLASAVVDAGTLKQANEAGYLECFDQELIFIDVPKIDVPIKIKEKIPVLILGNNLHHLACKEIELHQNSNDYLSAYLLEMGCVFDSSGQEPDYDLYEFVLNAFLTKVTYNDDEHFFHNTLYTDRFEINKLVLTKGMKINVGNQAIQLPKILYNLWVTRNAKGCSVTFSLDENLYKNEKMYSLVFEYKGSKLEMAANLIDEKYELFQRMFILMNVDIQRFKDLFEIATKKYPDIVNMKLDFGKRQTLLHLAVENENLDIIKTLVKAEADVKTKDFWGCTPRSLTKNDVIIKFLQTEEEKQDQKK